MRTPAKILRANGVSLGELADAANQTLQYVSMQLNGHRTLTPNLELALRELLPETIAGEVIRKRGQK